MQSNPDGVITALHREQDLRRGEQLLLIQFAGARNEVPAFEQQVVVALFADVLHATREAPELAAGATARFESTEHQS